MLIQTPELGKQQLAALDLLCADCKATDGNVVAIYRHLLGKNRGRPSNLLYYQQTLTAFLGAYFFQENACEIALMVAPEFRHQGIASLMLTALLPLLKSEGIDRLIFSSPHGLNDNWLPASGLCYQGSEFQMQRYSHEPIAGCDPTPHIRLATQADIPALCAIDTACFSTQTANMSARYENLLTDPALCLFVIHQGDDTPVGKAHITWQATGARLSDIATIPYAQGRGFGSALLTHCINYALASNKPDIILDVEATNKHALGLYTRHGFTINNAHDYFCFERSRVQNLSCGSTQISNTQKFGLTAFLNHL